MGCGGSKDKDKKEDAKSKQEEEKKKNDSTAEKKEETKKEENQQEAQDEEKKEEAAAAGAAAAEEGAAGEEGVTSREAVDGVDGSVPAESAEAIAAAESEDRTAIEIAAAEGQEEVERGCIETEAAVTNPVAPSSGAAVTSDGSVVASRTVKRRPVRDPNQPHTPRKPTSATPRAVPVSATFRDAEGNVIEDVPASTEAPAGEKEMLGVNGQLIELPKDAPEWKVMRPPPEDNSSWRILRQIRVVMQLQNVSAI